jgi:hypothetical protein
MRSAIAFKNLAKVIDITIDSGYTILVHGSSPVSSVMSFLYSIISDSGRGFFILPNLF